MIDLDKYGERQMISDLYDGSSPVNFYLPLA